jgi:hypothetical protein
VTFPGSSPAYYGLDRSSWGLTALDGGGVKALVDAWPTRCLLESSRGD